MKLLRMENYFAGSGVIGTTASATSAAAGCAAPTFGGKTQAQWAQLRDTFFMGGYVAVTTGAVVAALATPETGFGGVAIIGGALAVADFCFAAAEFCDVIELCMSMGLLGGCGE